MTTARNILSQYVHVCDGGKAAEIPSSESFWEELASGAYPHLERGRLLSAFTFSEPWSTWERHPAGEELVLLLSGAATLVLEESGVERCVSLSAPGDYVLIPKGIWHMARTTVPTAMLFLTPGAGTEHRPIGA
jgi:mannose-6-phosphate isomerase-like protein (cupin superfamily)